MLSLKVKISDPIGLHARPASLLASISSRYASDANLIYGSRKANMKSIINLMSLGVKSGADAIIEVDGTDEQIALKGIVDKMKEINLI
jgi:phosphocarrier protein